MVEVAGARQAVWAFIEHEHHDLAPGLNRIHAVACSIDRRSTPELLVDVLDVLRWFDTTLEPHMAWEESWLYPEIDARTGTTWATRATRFEHQQVRQLAAKLRAGQRELGHDTDHDPRVEARCRLFGLEALLRAHIEREERFLIPILNDDGFTASRPASPG